MNDYDSRQYSLMLRTMKEIRLNVKGIGKIVNSLESLLANLESNDPKWTDKIRSEWWTLEEIHAHNLSEGKHELTVQEKQWVEMALRNLEKLIQSKLDTTLT